LLGRGARRGEVRADRPSSSSRTPAGDLAPDRIAIEAVNVTKAYGAVLALDQVDFRAYAGEVNVLLGENGAGKSTLMRILAGEAVPDSGHVALAGRPVRFRSPRDARQHGVAIIHQELSLFPALTVAANIFAGHEHARAGLLDDRRHRALAAEILAHLDERIDPATPVDALAIGQQQVVEIAKALAHDARVVIMDEPTSALSNAEVDALFAVVRGLIRSDVAVVYISHRMDEIFRIANRLVVLRDGRRVAAAPARDVDMDWITEAMLGSHERAALEHMNAARDRRPDRAPDDLLEVTHLSLASADATRLLLNNVSFRLAPGEVLGVYGLLGAGKTELAESIAGLRPGASGAVRIGGAALPASVPTRIAAGIAFVPEDRQRQALIPTASVSDNMVLSSLARVAAGGVVSPRRQDLLTAEMISDLSIRIGSAAQPILSLSGGNQQKVVIARALLTNPKLLILDEPTRGIDVGAKAEIFRIMRRLAEDGLAILFVSSELPEITAVADRILVLSRGEVVGMFDAATAAEADVVRASVHVAPV